MEENEEDEPVIALWQREPSGMDDGWVGGGEEDTHIIRTAEVEHGGSGGPVAEEDGETPINVWAMWAWHDRTWLQFMGVAGLEGMRLEERPRGACDGDLAATCVSTDRCSSCQWAAWPGRTYGPGRRGR